MNLEIARLANVTRLQLAGGRGPLPAFILSSGHLRADSRTPPAATPPRLPVLDWSATLFDDAGAFID